MRLNERQRTFLRYATMKRARIERRSSWHSAVVPDEFGARVSCAFLRGAELTSMIGRYLITTPDGGLVVSAWGVRLGRLLALYDATLDLYNAGNGIGTDVDALLKHIEGLIYAKVKETEDK